MMRDLELSLVDLAKLRVRFDDDEELLEEIFRVFIAEAPDRRGNIRAALDNGDMVRLSGLAHSLKGVAGTMYAEELRQAALALEMAAKVGGTGEIADLVATLLDTLARTAEDLKRSF
jgi:histidine phosphotransfer protein HptB